MRQSIVSALSQMKTQKGDLLKDLANGHPLMVVFLRHFGCIFCMEAMRDIAKERDSIEGKGIQICFVHMASNEIAESYFKEYDLEGVDHVTDPECNYYEQFGLIKGNFGQLFGLQVWLRTAQLAVKDISQLRRKQIGDGFQMPGVFLIKGESVLNEYIHNRASDRPDYMGLIKVLDQ